MFYKVIKVVIDILLCLIMFALGWTCCYLVNRNSSVQEIEVKGVSSNEVLSELKGTTTHVTLTCYQPVEEQCDEDPLITADGSRIDLSELEKGNLRWCAISRDLLWLFPKDKPKRVYIESHGVYEVRDKMNSKWNHRIDILIHPNSQERFCKKNVKVVILD
jgi:3D (Asp-Asp-Asp) domain-containing protein